MKIKIACLPLLFLNFLLAGQTSSQVLPETTILLPDWQTMQNSAPEPKIFYDGSKNRFQNNLPDTTPKARLLSGNKSFDIYILPLDNTPCIVPNKMFKGNMKTMPQTFNNHKEQATKIPNPFKRENLIPQKN